MNNEFILQDRIQKIQQIVCKYGEENFYISYSGGKDSNTLSALVDLAVPENKIPRVYCNTGIEYKAIVNFVKEKAAADDRFIIIQPKVPIKQMLEEKGYPFKSKEHSALVFSYQKNGIGKWVTKYLKTEGRFACPNILRYQFTPEFTLHISDKCCEELKEKPIALWQRKNNKPYGILGIMPTEGGRRTSSKCLAFKYNGKLKNFQPLVAVTKEWEKWFIDKYQVDLPILYYPPYNFDRTGCKGCPFNPEIQQDLNIIHQYFPAEYKQCEIIWKPVYDEYRRLGYRLKKIDNDQLTFDDINIERIDE